MSDPPSWSGAGVILTFIDILDPSKLTSEAFDEYLIVEAVPNLAATGAIEWAWCYKAANPDHDKQRVLVYKVSDLEAVHAGVLTNIPRTSNLGYFQGDLEQDHLIHYESRIYSLVQLYETSKQKEEAPPTIMIALKEPLPGGEAELDNWYREEHNERMSQEPGWKRTTRFRLIFQHTNGFKESQELSFLAIHEFGEDHKLGKDVPTLEPMSDRTKKVVSEARALDAAIYHKYQALQKN